MGENREERSDVCSPWASQWRCAARSGVARVTLPAPPERGQASAPRSETIPIPDATRCSSARGI
eukprot:698387-Pyramimonas_sp.AAC.1